VAALSYCWNVTDWRFEAYVTPIQLTVAPDVPPVMPCVPKSTRSMVRRPSDAAVIELPPVTYVPVSAVTSRIATFALPILHVFGVPEIWVAV
jgi:hypothetical protein